VCAAVAAVVSELAVVSVFGVDGAPAMPAAYPVMCVRTSISFARVASSIVALDAPDFAAPVVPVAPGVDVDVESLPTMSVMILSTAATSVPQLAFFALADLPVLLLGCAVLAAGFEPIFSRLLKWRFNSASAARFFAGIDVAEIPFAACWA
jgi:hypothetical protein